ncbi:hypothetical protein LOTGIDRAFT_161759 [Lottia gigantea]|uniref:Uncharacterized protein n=1 Tax=Lottia gigantea TaxID=225164 RepID=V4ADK2_LOTGI|nr:hypothetical protein LOTGIDRAFT_161759 [Lottia gigantea]ESO93205.1 hypothetical protein LOTGIDRAFT_161759 [Lottia gigantea]
MVLPESFPSCENSVKSGMIGVVPESDSVCENVISAKSESISENRSENESRSENDNRSIAENDNKEDNLRVENWSVGEKRSAVENGSVVEIKSVAENIPVDIKSSVSNGATGVSSDKQKVIEFVVAPEDECDARDGDKSDEIISLDEESDNIMECDDFSQVSRSSSNSGINPRRHKLVTAPNKETVLKCVRDRATVLSKKKKKESKRKSSFKHVVESELPK